MKLDSSKKIKKSGLELSDIYIVSNYNTLYVTKRYGKELENFVINAKFLKNILIFHIDQWAKFVLGM